MYFPLSSDLIVANGWCFNNGIASVEAEILRDVAEIHAAHYAVNQLSIATIDDETILAELGYDIYGLRSTFLQ